MVTATVEILPVVIEPSTSTGTGTTSSTSASTSTATPSTNVSVTKTVTNGDGSTTVTFNDGATAVYTGFGTDNETEVSYTPAQTAASGTGNSNNATVDSGSNNNANGVGSNASDISSSSNSNSSAPTNVPGTVKVPATTTVVSNPLHQFASWSYAWSLWWLDVDDYNNLLDGADAGTGNSYILGPNSYVVAEDSGLYPGRRLPTQAGLNYNIQTVNFETIIANGTKTKSTNVIEGSMTILEPYGVTFIDSLVQAAVSLNSGFNYLQQPYLLQLDFKGYDNAGNPIPDNLTALYRKRFPIKLNTLKVGVTNKGAEYQISYTPVGHQAHHPEHSTTPKNVSVTVTGGTVKEFLDNFAIILNSYWQLEVTDGKAQFADTIKFDMDPAIASSTIIYPTQDSITQANPNANSIQLTGGSFDIPAGTQITTVIQKVLEKSSYLRNQLGLNFQSLTAAQQQTSLTQILNTFKTVCTTIYAGSDGAGNLNYKAFDNVRNTYPVQFTYNIHQYANLNPANHPAAPFLTDSRANTVKAYNYIYTGKNTDILDFKINFDSTYYTAVAAYTGQYAATQATPSTGLNTAIANGGVVLLSPQLLATSGVIPGFNGIANLTPLKYRAVNNDQRDTIGLGIINDPVTQTVSNVIKSLYTNYRGDMVTLEMQIVGDPTLIKQDDWLYVPSPTKSSTYNSWDNLSQNDFAKKYGHLQMDVGSLMASVTINTPLDIDTDWTNQGVVFPQPGTYKSLFSGQYQITVIKNSFSNGKFEQTLSMNRVINHDLINSAAPAAATNGRDASTTGTNTTGQTQTNQNSVNQTIQQNSGSTATPASETATTVQGTAVNAGTFYMPSATAITAPTYTPTLNPNALQNGVQARQ